jgi:hypothetical protein
MLFKFGFKSMIAGMYFFAVAEGGKSGVALQLLFDCAVHRGRLNKIDWSFMNSQSLKNINNHQYRLINWVCFH